MQIPFQLTDDDYLYVIYWAYTGQRDRRHRANGHLLAIWQKYAQLPIVEQEEIYGKLPERKSRRVDKGKQRFFATDRKQLSHFAIAYLEAKGGPRPGWRDRLLAGWDSMKMYFREWFQVQGSDQGV